MSIYCHKCKTNTQTIPPVFLRKPAFNKYHILGICENCKWTKGGYLPGNVVSALPTELCNLKTKWNYMEYIDVNGEMKKLYPYIDQYINSTESLCT